MGATSTSAAALVVPCGAAKLDREATAAELYTGSAFKLQLAAAQALAAETGERVLILSALYGLVDPDEVLEPYDVMMGQPGSVTAHQLALQLLALGVRKVYAFLPGAYRARLADGAAFVGVPVFDVYEGNRGIGDMRGIATSVRRYAAVAA